VTSLALARPATRPALGVAMVLVAAVLFAFNGTVSKLLIQGGFDAPRLTALRAGGAFLGLLVLILVNRPGISRLRTTRRELPKLISFGLTGFFLVPMLYFVAISRLPVGIGLLFEFTAPVFVALWVRFGEHQQVRRRLWVGLACCVAGMLCVAQIWAGEIRLDLLGVAAGLTSAVLLAVYYVLGSRSVANRDPLSLTCWAFGVSAIAGAIARPWWEFDPGLLAGTSDGVPMWLLVIYLLALGTIVPYLLISTSMKHLPPTSVGIIGMTELALAAGFAWILLREELLTAQVLGGLLVFGGVVLAETARSSDVAGRDMTESSDVAGRDMTVRASRTPEIPPT
jgi:drug/metabolite transporter (DMT)-like permease